jgi:hypothetical protein
VNGRKNDLAAKGAHAELRLLANRLHGWRSCRRRTRSRNERPAPKRYNTAAVVSILRYTAEAIEPLYTGFDGLGRPRTDADP